MSAAAKQAGVGPGALKRAKRDLRVESNKAALEGPWMWALPQGDGPGDVGSLGAEDGLEGEINSAILADDRDRAHAAIRAWRTYWFDCFERAKAAA